jgi:hypothetical protein
MGQKAGLRSVMVVLVLLVGTTFSFAQSEPEEVAEATEVTERLLKVSDYRQKMMAGWIGQMVGVGWGGPTEFRFQNRTIPEDEVPEWKPELVNVWGQDDLYVEMTFLRSLEEYGLDVSMRQAGIDFAKSKYMLWHANKAGRDNLRAGIAPPDSSHPQFNSHADDIDYQIEADFSGLISPGLPNSVIALGEKFGRLMNYGDGVYAGQFVGCMYAEAFFEDDPLTIVEAGLRCIPEESQYAEMVQDVVTWYEAYPDDWEATWQEVNKKYHENPDYTRWLCTEEGADFNIDAKINGAYIVMGMLYSKGDFDQSIIISMRCGQDSDCNPSNAAGVLFTTSHFDSLDDKYVSALEQGPKFSYTEYDFQALADVCVKLARQIVTQAGGRIEVDEDGDEFFVIPVQAPNPSALEKSWEAGPIAGTEFTSDDFPHLKWLWLTPYVMWILLLAAYVLLKENRSLQGLWIFAAILVTYLIWTILSKTLSDIAPAIGQSNPMSLVVGLAIVFLLGERLAGLKWPALICVSSLIIAVTGFIGLSQMNSIYYDGLQPQILAVIIGGAIAIVLSATFTAKNCQKRSSNKRFLLFLLLWFVVVNMVPSMAASVGAFGWAVVAKYSWWFLPAAGAQGLLLYLLTLPLWILALKNSFYNRRLKSCLNLPNPEASGN